MRLLRAAFPLKSNENNPLIDYDLIQFVNEKFETTDITSKAPPSFGKPAGDHFASDSRESTMGLEAKDREIALKQNEIDRLRQSLEALRSTVAQLQSKPKVRDSWDDQSAKKPTDTAQGNGTYDDWGVQPAAPNHRTTDSKLGQSREVDLESCLTTYSNHSTDDADWSSPSDSPTCGMPDSPSGLTSRNGHSIVRDENSDLIWPTTGSWGCPGTSPANTWDVAPITGIWKDVPAFTDPISNYGDPSQHETDLIHQQATKTASWTWNEPTHNHGVPPGRDCPLPSYVRGLKPAQNSFCQCGKPRECNASSELPTRGFGGGYVAGWQPAVPTWNCDDTADDNEVDSW